jgi:hypothetical protein
MDPSSSEMTRLGNNVSTANPRFNIIPEIGLQLTELVVAAFTAISVLI